MSNSLGIIFSKEDKPQILGYYEYNGTVDICYPIIRDSEEEIQKHWREGEFKYCSKSPECEDIPVYIYSDYGQGYHWEGTICLYCKVITSDLMWDRETEKDGRPDGIPTNYELIMARNVSDENE
jgi:hypothetical protein